MKLGQLSYAPVSSVDVVKYSFELNEIESLREVKPAYTPHCCRTGMLAHVLG